MKYLAPFSTVANVITILSFGIIAYYMFNEPITTVDRHPYGNLAEFPFFFGTVLFALEAIGVVSFEHFDLRMQKIASGIYTNFLCFFVVSLYDSI